MYATYDTLIGYHWIFFTSVVVLYALHILGIGLYNFIYDYDKYNPNYKLPWAPKSCREHIECYANYWWLCFYLIALSFVATALWPLLWAIVIVSGAAYIVRAVVRSHIKASS